MKKIKTADFVILLLFILVVISVFKRLPEKKAGRKILIVKTASARYAYPLDKDRVLEFQGLLGKSRIVIAEDSAFFEDSPCRNRICIHSSPVKNSGEWSACLPNHIAIYVESDEVDALAK